MIPRPANERRQLGGDSRLLSGPLVVTRAHPKRGSVLVPLVAAMLILLLMGVALSEVFGVQRMKSVIAVESTRAFWIAEAGLWHARHEGAAISTPVTFAGGEYTTAKSGSEFTATGTLDQATRIVTLSFATGGSGPLDVVASAATADDHDDDEFRLDLVSISAVDVVIESFELSSDVSSEEITELKYNDERIWKEGSGESLPTGDVDLNRGTTSDRTIPAGSSERLEMEFDDDMSGNQALTLVLHFTDGSSSTIAFTIDW